MALTWRERMALARLYGADNNLHSQIAGAYARGKHRGDLIRKQNEVRGEIRRLERKKSDG